VFNTPNSVEQSVTKSSIQAQLDKLPDGLGSNYNIRTNADGSFSIVRKDGSSSTLDAVANGEITPLRVTEEGNLYTPNAVPSKHGNTLGNQPAELYELRNQETGNVVKIGETTHGELKYGQGNQKRYTKDELKEMNARYVPQSTGSKADMYDLQNLTLEEYKAKYGKYPEYNKNGR
jgi:hypothetical protein